MSLAHMVHNPPQPRSEPLEEIDPLRPRVRVRADMRRALLLLLCFVGTACPDPAPAEPAPAGPASAETPLSAFRTGSTTVSSYVQLGWTGTLTNDSLLDPPCRPEEAVPPAILAPAADGRWTAIAIGQTRIPCGGNDAIAVYVRATDHLVIRAPEVVRQDEVFSVHVSAHDRDGELLHRNGESASWELDGLAPGSRTGCMDFRSSTGDDALVEAAAVGSGRIVVALDGREAHADVTITAR